MSAHVFQQNGRHDAACVHSKDIFSLGVFYKQNSAWIVVAGAATGKPPVANIRGLYQAEESESAYSRQPSLSTVPAQQPVQRAGSLNMNNRGLLKQGNEQAPGEVFGNGRLVRPKVILA